eukprot:RCo021550
MAHTHPLEGDGIQVNLFHYLWKKGILRGESQLKFKIPDTIVMFNQPTIWYTWSDTQNEIRKRSGKELERSTILSRFCRRKEEDCDIVASFVSHRLDEEDTVEFFDERGLTEFLMRRTNQQGLLQKFVIPKGDHNEMIQAIWSPRLCMVNKRVNRHFLSDKNRPGNDRCITYEGPTHFTEEALTASAVRKKIEDVCLSVVDHFKIVEHYYQLSRMVLYFKEGRESGSGHPGDNSLWLMFSSSLRVDEIKFQRKKAPLLLTPQFKGLYNELLDEDHPRPSTRAGSPGGGASRGGGSGGG